MVKVWGLIGTVHPEDKAATLLEVVLLNSISVAAELLPILSSNSAKKEVPPSQQNTARERDSESSSSEKPNTSSCIKSVWPTRDNIVIGTHDNRIVLVPWRENEGEDGTATSASEKRVLSEGHSMGRVRGLATHPVLAVCATAAEDSTVRIWHLSKRKVLAAARVATVPTCLDFSPDGLLLAVGGQDGTVQVLAAEVRDKPQSSAASLTWKHSMKSELPVTCIRFSDFMPGQPPRLYLVVGTAADGDDGGKIVLYDVTQVRKTS
jgi:hypothetical protein